jgi:hypothetical protein
MDENVENIAMQTRYGSYEFLVMPFELWNAPSMFMTFINSIFHEKLDEFVIIYIDDILMYYKTAIKHVKHLKYVLNTFQQNKLFANRTKSEFAEEKMDFLRPFIKGMSEA